MYSQLFHLGTISKFLFNVYHCRCRRWTRAVARVARPSVGWSSLQSALWTAGWPSPTPAWPPVPVSRIKPDHVRGSTQSFRARLSSLRTINFPNISRALSLYRTVILRRTQTSENINICKDVLHFPLIKYTNNTTQRYTIWCDFLAGKIFVFMTGQLATTICLYSFVVVCIMQCFLICFYLLSLIRVFSAGIKWYH